MLKPLSLPYNFPENNSCPDHKGSPRMSIMRCRELPASLRDLPDLCNLVAMSQDPVLATSRWSISLTTAETWPGKADKENCIITFKTLSPVEPSSTSQATQQHPRNQKLLGFWFFFKKRAATEWLIAVGNQLAMALRSAAEAKSRAWSWPCGTRGVLRSRVDTVKRKCDLAMASTWKNHKFQPRGFPLDYLIKGSLDEKLPSYEVLKITENRCQERKDVKREKMPRENRCQERLDAQRE